MMIGDVVNARAEKTRTNGPRGSLTLHWEI